MEVMESNETIYRTYKIRWYLLCIISVHTCIYNAAWAEFAPIAQSTKVVFGWEDSDINMLINYGNIGTIATLIPMTWIVFSKGPFIVPEPVERCDINGTISNSSIQNCSDILYTNVSLLQTRINLLNYIEFGCAFALFIMVCIFFPNKPDNPPSVSAKSDRLGVKEGTLLAVRQRKFWHIVLSFAIPSGVYGAWVTTLDVILHPFGISQTEAGMLSFYGSLGGIVCGLILSRCSDIFLRKTKIIMIVIYSFATVFLVLFASMCFQLLPHSKWMFYATCISACVCIAGVMPLYYEMICENMFPVSEAVISGFLTLMENLTNTVFLLVSLIPNTGSHWQNWAVISCTGLTIPMLVFFKDRQKRLDLDIPASSPRLSSSISYIQLPDDTKHSV